MPRRIDDAPTRPWLPGNYDIGAYADETNQSIPVGTTLSVLGALLSIVRERFIGTDDANDKSIPWVWVPVEGDLHEEDPQKSTISIVPEMESDNERHDKLPAIYIGRGDITTQAREGTGYKAGENIKTGKQLKLGSVYGPYTFRIRANGRGVSETIGNILFEWFWYNQDSIRKFFQFRDIGPFSLSREVPVPKQTDVYETTLSFRLSWDHRWSTQSKALVVSELSLRIYGTQDPNATLETLEQNSSNLLAEVAKIKLTP